MLVSVPKQMTDEVFVDFSLSEEVDRLENLLETLEKGEIEIAKEWLKSAIRLLREEK